MWLGCGILEVLLTTSSGQHLVLLRMHFCLLSHQKPFFSRVSEGVDPKSSSKSHKSCFCLSFIFIFNSFFYSTICYVPEIASRPPMSIYNAVSSWNRVVLSRRSLSQCCWLLSVTEEWLPPMFCSILILETSAHPASLLRMLLHNLSYFTYELDHFSSLPPAVTHL